MQRCDSSRPPRFDANQTFVGPYALQVLHEWQRDTPPTPPHWSNAGPIPRRYWSTPTHTCAQGTNRSEVGRTTEIPAVCRAGLMLGTSVLFGAAYLEG
ncbi:hypothetical protein Pmani_039028 [Petrolisthes manimaculis]|uniref:Uncharacterized protein n=1 Tax=Petrolisthes manimaculis TaxID=1843537 RepID=A0AAE1TJY7_9EUCA|nr:hypothetical protein Pmani_039028 [Petrolisthes manimaculis]